MASHPERERRPGARRRRARLRRVGLRVRPRRRREGRARGDEDAPPGRRRDSRLGERRRGADRPPLRPFRRPAAHAARPLGVRSVRAGGAGRLPVRPRHRGRQGQRLPPAEGCPAARRGGGAARQRQGRLRRRGGDRRPLDRRLPGRGRARCRRLPHLRQRHASGGHARLRPGSAGARLLPRPPDGPASATFTPACSAARR